MNGLTLVVLFCVGVSQTALAETQCTQFDYDRKLLEQLVRVEAENKEYAEKLGELESTIEDLKQDLVLFTNNVREEIKDVVTEATKKVVTIPDVESDGWELVFRVTAGNHDNVHHAWTEGIETTTVKPENMKRSTNKHYRNHNAIADWEIRGIEQVKYSLFENEAEVAYIIFNGLYSTRDSWFDQSRVMNSSWPKLLLDETYNYFSIEGHPEVKRRFFINHNYGGCPLDQGYTVVIDTGIATQHICDWDHQPEFPQILYSKINGLTVWNRPMFGRADYAAVYIRWYRSKITQHVNVTPSQYWVGPPRLSQHATQQRLMLPFGRLIVYRAIPMLYRALPTSVEVVHAFCYGLGGITTASKRIIHVCQGSVIRQ